MSRERPSVDLAPAAAWAVLLIASTGVLIAGAELMVVAIALPSIVVDFGSWTDLARVSWIVNGYLLAFVVAMPLAGRAADVWGARRMYVIALLLFALGSAAAASSRIAGSEAGLAWLIAARVVQGLGGGALVPLSMTLASHLFVGRARAAALGVEGAATFVGMAVGPAYGAWVLLNVHLPVAGLDIAPWQWIFLLNVPIALLVLLVLYVVAGGVETPRLRAPLDLGGGGLVAGALIAGVGALSLAGARGWTDPLVIGGLMAGGLGLVLFVVYERSRRMPLIDPRLLANRRFGAANAVSLLTGYTLATAIIGGPVFVDRVLAGSGHIAAGASVPAAALTALTLSIAIGAVVGGLAASLFGERLLTALGVVITAVGLSLALGWGTGTEVSRLVRDLAVFGAGFGLTVSPRATAAVAAAGSGAYGVASAMLQITRTVGMSIGLALLTSIGQSRIDELSALVNHPVRRDALVTSLHHPEFVGIEPADSARLVDLLEAWSRGQAAEVLHLVFAIALGVAALTLVPALLLGPRRRGERREIALLSRPSPTDPRPR